MLHRIAIMVAAIAVGSAGIATDALARGGSGGGGGGGHCGGAMSEGYLCGIGVGHLGGRAEHRRYRGWGPYGYYGDNGYYNPSIVAPDEQPTVALDEQP